MTDQHSRSAIIALTTSLGVSAAVLRSVAPLSPTEWSTLRHWLEGRQMTPADLMSGPTEFTGLDYALSYRVQHLLEYLEEARRAEDALADRGIWIISCVDDAYPLRWHERLGRTAPPVLYGDGSSEHLSYPGIGIVGSRDIPAALVEIANDLGAASVLGAYGVVSGGARGTDRIGMQGALEVNGTVVSIVPDHLQRDRLRQPNRVAIEAGYLTMASAVHPDTPFSVGNAMYRNRLIYALSDLTIVVSTSGNGGTWSGATQDLERRWAPLAVWTGPGAPVGNHELVARGGYPFDIVPASASDMRAFVAAATQHFAKSTPRIEPVTKQLDLLGLGG